MEGTLVFGATTCMRRIYLQALLGCFPKARCVIERRFCLASAYEMTPPGRKECMAHSPRSPVAMTYVSRASAIYGAEIGLNSQLGRAGTGAGKGHAVLGDAFPPLGKNAPPDRGSLTSLGKGSAGDAAPGEGVTGVSKSLLVRSRIWSTNSCTCGSADTPPAFSWLAGMLALKSRTPV